MLEQVKAYYAILQEGDTRQRKSGGSPRHHLGDAFTPAEFTAYEREIRLFQKTHPHAVLVDSLEMFAKMRIPDVRAVLLHTTFSNKQASEIHGFLSSLGLHNDTSRQVVLSEDQMQAIERIARRSMRDEGR